MQHAIFIARGERVSICGRNFTAKQKLILCTETEYFWLAEEGGLETSPTLRDRAIGEHQRVNPSQLEIEMEMLEEIQPAQVEVKA